MKAVHTSDRSTFRRCRRKWDFTSSLRRNLEPIVPQTALFEGSGVHAALEAYYAGKSKDLRGVFQEWADQRIAFLLDAYPSVDLDNLNASVADGLKLLERYQAWAEVVDPQYFTEVLGTEVQFKLPIPFEGEEVVYGGRLDGIVKDKIGLLWVLEHKTAAQLQTNHLFLDDQTTSYVWAAQELLGQPIEGVLFNIMRKKQPKTILRSELDRYFVRVQVQRSANEIKNHVKYVQWQIQEMLTPTLPIYPNPTRDCNWDCAFMAPCVLMNDGGNVEALLKSEYLNRGETDKFLLESDVVE